jgi:hypothetical protein
MNDEQGRPLRESPPPPPTVYAACRAVYPRDGRDRVAFRVGTVSTNPRSVIVCPDDINGFSGHIWALPTGIETGDLVVPDPDGWRGSCLVRGKLAPGSKPGC